LFESWNVSRNGTYDVAGREEGVKKTMRYAFKTETGEGPGEGEPLP